MAKLNNKQRVYSAVLKGGKRTRIAISNHLGLSTTAVSKSLSMLRKEGALQVSGKLKGEELHYTTDKTPKHQTKRDPFAGVQPAGTPTEDEQAQQELVPADVETSQGGYEDIPVYWIDGEPMVYDLDLAGALGYSRPNKIRDLLHRLADNLGPNGVYTTAVYSGGKESTAYYLGEKAALKVVTKSETSKADAITDQVIEVFIQARKGQLPAQQPEQPALPKYEATRNLDQHLEIAQLLGLDEDMAKAAAARLTYQETGVDVPALLKAGGHTVDEQDRYLCPRDLAALVDSTAREINLVLEEAGFQCRPAHGKHKWLPTSEASGFYTWHPYKSEHSEHTGYQLLWDRDVLDRIDVAVS